MNLVFIYGPPASGKLTIANELSQISGIPVFHNHMTRDLVQSLYPADLSEHYGLVNKLRNDVFEYCAIHGTDLIFTFVYEGPADDQSVKAKVAAVRNNGGQVVFVEVTAHHEDLLARVDNAERHEHNKLTDKTKLESLLDNIAGASIPDEEMLHIDTSTVQPAEAAALICRHYGLPARCCK